MEQLKFILRKVNNSDIDRAIDMQEEEYKGFHYLITLKDNTNPYTKEKIAIDVPLAIKKFNVYRDELVDINRISSGRYAYNVFANDVSFWYDCMNEWFETSIVNDDFHGTFKFDISKEELLSFLGDEIYLVYVNHYFG